MSLKDLKEFFKKIEEDESFRDEMKKDEELKNNVPVALIDAAARKGFIFTIDEYKEAVSKLRKAKGKQAFEDLVSIEYLTLLKSCDTGSASSCSTGNPSGVL